MCHEIATIHSWTIQHQLNFISLVDTWGVLWYVYRHQICTRHQTDIYEPFQNYILLYFLFQTQASCMLWKRWKNETERPCCWDLESHKPHYCKMLIYLQQTRMFTACRLLFPPTYACFVCQPHLTFTISILGSLASNTIFPDVFWSFELDSWRSRSLLYKILPLAGFY